MKIIASKYLCVGALLSALSASLVHATVIDSANVGTLTTFEDTSTGRVWLDMNNFYNASATVGTTGFDMISIAQANGFTFATKADVQQLLNTLPLGSGQWNSYASVMGYGIPRHLIWGMYDDGDGNPYGYAWSFSTDSSWNYVNGATDASTVQNFGAAGSVDMGIWAFRSGESSVPDTGATVALLGLSFAGLATLRRKR